MLHGVQWNCWMFLPKCFLCLTSSKFHSLIPSIRIKTLHHFWLWCLYSWAKWVWWIALCPKNYVIAGRSIQLENPFTRCSTHRATVHYVLVNSSSCYSARRLLPPDHNVLSVTYSTFVRSYTARITVYVYCTRVYCSCVLRARCLCAIGRSLLHRTVFTVGTNKNRRYLRRTLQYRFGWQYRYKYFFSWLCLFTAATNRVGFLLLLFLVLFVLLYWHFLMFVYIDMRSSVQVNVTTFDSLFLFFFEREFVRPYCARTSNCAYTNICL